MVTSFHYLKLGGVSRLVGLLRWDHLVFYMSVEQQQIESVVGIFIFDTLK